jgi:acyl-CoA dehydrogenase
MSPLIERAKGAAELASHHADAVDKAARFPAEAILALREAKLLGAMVPPDLGGEGASLGTIAALCHLLGQHCAATAMIFAMHQIQVACLVRHGQGSAWHRQLLRRLATGQLLLASATSEAGIGGDVRSSFCAAEVSGDRLALEKNATVISYGEHADGILATARRAADSPPSDQVLVAVLKEDYRLERTGGWDTLGMRGTCSNGYLLRAAAASGQILPVPYADISAATMLPVSHLTWSSLWLGIATDAVARAQAFVRAEAKRRLGSTPPVASRLAEAMELLQLMRGNVQAGIRHFEAAEAAPERLASLGGAVLMNGLKTGSARLVVEIVTQALRICGIHGYRNDSRYSLGRHLRDAHSAALMVGNDRIHANTANLLLAHRPDLELGE